MSELTDELMGGIDQNTYNDTALSKMKVFKNNLVKRIEIFNSYIKYGTERKYTKNNNEPDIKNKTEPDTENETKPVTKIVAKKKNTNPNTNPGITQVLTQTLKQILNQIMT